MMRANVGVDLLARSGELRLRKSVARVSERCVCIHIALLAQPLGVVDTFTMLRHDMADASISLPTCNYNRNHDHEKKE
jgi:hypothetical protein